MSSVRIHARSRSDVHVGDVRQQQLEALLAGGVDGGVEGCRAIVGIVAQVRERKKDSRTLHALGEDRLEKRSVSKDISLSSMSASSQEQLNAPQVPSSRRSVQGKEATRVDRVAVCASV
jgi:hypothetical protein